MKFPRLWAIIPLAAFFISASAWADGTRGGGWHGPMWGGGWYGMIFGPLVMIFIFAAIIVVAVLAIRWLSGTGPSQGQSRNGKTAVDILEERFARGEIDAGELQERKRILED